MPKKLPAWLRWAVFSVIILMLCPPPNVAHAHPVDMYAQEQFVSLAQSGVSIDWKITPGPLLADTVWAASDSNQDGAISPSEAQEWIAPFLAQYTLTLDDQPLNLRVKQLHWPAVIEHLRTGEESIQIQIAAPWPGAGIGEHRIQIHNAYLESNSINWFSLNTNQGGAFELPIQNNGQLEATLHIPAESTGLVSWNSGQPDLAGIGGAVSSMALDFAKQQNQSDGFAAATSALLGLVKTQDVSPLFLTGAFLLSLLLGSLHALTPGHGKTLVAAYLVGSRGRNRDAVFLGLVVTLTHTGSVVFLGLLTLLASQYILPGVIAPWLEIASGLLVVIFGLNLFLQRRKTLSSWQTELVDEAHHHHDPHEHHHEHDHNHPHGHVHAPVGAVTWKSLLALGVSGGLVPCPDAIAILLVAVAINRILFGILLILSFSLGLALVLIAIGIAMVQGLRLVARNDLFNRFSVYAPLVSAVLVSALGIGLTVSAVKALAFTSAQAAHQNGQTALLYLLPDDNGKHQLMRLSLTGDTAIPYTHDPDGLAGYTLSPDGNTIVYTVFHADDKSTLWAMNADGSNAHTILDCKEGQCSGPVWYPDGNRLVYQRVDYSNNAPRFSLWWLDVTNGETRPVFQDGTFASYAPAFSPDGQWLGYKSPVNNTLQLYHLLDRRVISIPIPLQSGAAETWSPNGDALLFWDAASIDPATALHVKRYDLASGRKTDLGGEPSQVDYAATWSPDGAWVAIDREPPLSAPSKRGDQVWLMRPDGSDARLLLGEADTSYSDISWARDGAALVYTRYSYQNIGESEIWQVDVKTGVKTRLAAGGILPTLLP